MRLASLFLIACSASAQMRMLAVPTKSPLVSFRVVFLAGSAADPAEKPGVAYLTAMMLANSGSKQLTYQQISDALYPMAASVDVDVDKEMVTFSGSTHVNNLKAYYKLLRGILLEPGWRADDFARVKQDAVNSIETGLRANDEELAKEVLYSNIYNGTPYGHYRAGTVSSLQKLTLDDCKSFYHAQYSQNHLILGISGGYGPEFVEAVEKDFRTLPAAGSFRLREKPPSLIEASRAVIVTKDTRSVAISIGFPISTVRGNPDYVPLLVASSYLGQHRMSGGVLYDVMREKRGLNYGDYSYIEYFPRGMYQMEPSPNLARRYQMFQIWIRPVEPPNAKFAVRLALYELNKLIKEGIPETGFTQTRDFLSKYVNFLTRTQSSALGYGLDSLYFSIPNYNTYVRNALANLTRDQVNAVIRRHLRTNKLAIVFVAKDGEALKQELTSDDPSAMHYIAPKSDAIMEEDKTVEKWPLGLKAENITVVPASGVFQ
ncbi:MAG TPA: pitrilysin family protein [Candidatus Limnocylindrales bacterium]|nr:pitrilysin family protein [Candidatus Limnocylindrales bacterium]